MTPAVTPAYGPRAVLLGATAVLAAGAVLAALEVGAIAWSLYVLGYAGLVLSFAAIALSGRRRSTPSGWAMAAALFAAALLALPRLLMVWAIHAENAVVHDLFMPLAASPLATGGAAGAWLAIAVLAALARRETGFATRGAALVAAAALMLVPFELRLLPQVFWVSGSVLLLLAAASAAGESGSQHPLRAGSHA